MGPTWGPPGSCRPQIDPMLTPWTLLSRYSRHPIGRPFRVWCMFQLLSLRWCMYYHDILGCVSQTPDCIYREQPCRGDKKFGLQNNGISDFHASPSIHRALTSSYSVYIRDIIKIVWSNSLNLEESMFRSPCSWRRSLWCNSISPLGKEVVYMWCAASHCLG